MAKGKSNVKATVLLPVRPEGKPNAELIRVRPRNISDRIVEIDAGSFCDAARMAAANPKPLPSY